MNKLTKRLIYAGLLFLLPTPLFANHQYVNLATYLDGSYNYLTHRNQFISGIADRVYDVEENGFTLHQAALTLSYRPYEELGGLINIVIGKDALVIAPYGYDPKLSGDMDMVFSQAYFQYHNPPFSVMAGQFISLAGIEAIDPTQNQHFSRSLLFGYGIPKLQLGLRTLLEVSEALTLIVGLNNGWDTIRDFSRDKTLECGFQHRFWNDSLFSIMLYSGEERLQFQSVAGPSGRRNLLDLILEWPISEKLSIATNVDYGVQNNALLDNGGRGKAIWLGVAGYLNYQFNQYVNFAVRLEDFNDKAGYRTGITQNLKEVTFTVGFTPIKNLILRAEVREDFSNVFVYPDKHQAAQSDLQQSFGLELLYHFNFG